MAVSLTVTFGNSDDDDNRDNYTNDKINGDDYNGHNNNGVNDRDETIMCAP